MIVSDTMWLPEIKPAGRAKYLGLAEGIRDGIQNGNLSPGDQLLPVRELAYQLGVTPGTVARAYSRLKQEGVLIAGVGRGTFAADPANAKQPTQTRSEKITFAQDYEIERGEQEIFLLSPRMPERGQAAILREGMVHLANTMTDQQLLWYPNRSSELAARVAFSKSVENAPIGPVSADDVVLTSGGQSAIIAILHTAITGSSPKILVDELGYSGFRRAAEICRAEVIGVAWDADGPIPEAFEAAIVRHRPVIYCASPEVCNPTVRTTSIQRRHQIAAIAIKYGLHVLDDDCYRNAPHVGPSYRALLPELGWYVSSPSKSLTAALRIGFALAPQTYRQALIRTAMFTSFGVARPLSDLYAFLMAHPETPLAQDRVRDWVVENVKAAVNVLGGFQITWNETVPFLWIELPSGWRAGQFVQAADAKGVMIKSAEDFSLRDARCVHAVRIALNGAISTDRFIEGLEILRDLLNHPPEHIEV